MKKLLAIFIIATFFLAVGGCSYEQKCPHGTCAKPESAGESSEPAAESSEPAAESSEPAAEEATTEAAAEPAAESEEATE